jgi:ABC-type spermidine/putrescine transport system permease subunit II
MRFSAARFRGKKLLLPLMLSPVVVPSIITAISMYHLRLIGNYSGSGCAMR